MKLLLLLTLFFPISAYAQTTLTGVVSESATGKPIARASVFLNNTSIGTTTDDQGRFQLSLPAGKYELVISSVGYQTYSTPVSPGFNDVLAVSLDIKVDEMDAVVIEPYEKNGWKNYGKFFLEHFIGTSANADDCKILNKEVIRFRRSRKTGELTAMAAEPLIIENKALGYKVRYQLESFSYNYSKGMLIFSGFPFFENMPGSRSQVRKWQLNRKAAYYGSMMHFMRSIYANTVRDEGFILQGMMGESVNASGSSKSRNLSMQTIPSDSIAYIVDSTTTAMSFSGDLTVVFTKATVPAEYLRMTQMSISRFHKGAEMSSGISLINKRPVEIYSNGSYYNPTDIISKGYWSWSEKIANMLPVDYKAEEK